VKTFPPFSIDKTDVREMMFTMMLCVVQNAFPVGQVYLKQAAEFHSWRCGRPMLSIGVYLHVMMYALCRPMPSDSFLEFTLYVVQLILSPKAVSGQCAYWPANCYGRKFKCLETETRMQIRNKFLFVHGCHIATVVRTSSFSLYIYIYIYI